MQKKCTVHLRNSSWSPLGQAERPQGAEQGQGLKNCPGCQLKSFPLVTPESTRKASITHMCNWAWPHGPRHYGGCTGSPERISASEG